MSYLSFANSSCNTLLFYGLIAVLIKHIFYTVFMCILYFYSSNGVVCYLPATVMGSSVYKLVPNVRTNGARFLVRI